MKDILPRSTGKVRTASSWNLTCLEHTPACAQRNKLLQYSKHNEILLHPSIITEANNTMDTYVGLRQKTFIIIIITAVVVLLLYLLCSAHSGGINAVTTL